MRGNPVGQGQKCVPPIRVGLAQILPRDPVVRTTHRGPYAQHQDSLPCVALGAFDTGILYGRPDRSSGASGAVSHQGHAFGIQRMVCPRLSHRHGPPMKMQSLWSILHLITTVALSARPAGRGRTECFPRHLHCPPTQEKWCLAAGPAPGLPARGPRHQERLQGSSTLAVGAPPGSAVAQLAFFGLVQVVPGRGRPQ